MGRLETEAQQSRSGAAEYLHELADQLDGDGDVTLELGGTTVVPTPPEPITVKLAGKSDWSEGDTEAKRSIEFELVWWREAHPADEDTLDIHE